MHDVVKICETCECEFGDKALTVCPMDGGRLLIVGADSDPLIGTTIDGRFDVLALIGRGGMGSVYRVRQRSMDREIALKLLPQQTATEPSAVKRFLNEAKSVSRLTHPNIVTVYDFGQTAGGLLYLAMELVDGETLRQAIGRRTLRSDDIAAILRQILLGLGEAHEQRVVHRDLKPSNIMIQRKIGHRYLVKILDFGLAKVRDGSGPQSQTSQLCGTPKYISPEQALMAEVSEKTDVYQFGLIAYELLSGQAAFSGKSPLELVTKHASEPPPRFSAIPEDSSERLLLEACLEKKPAQRPTVAQLLKGLEHVDTDRWTLGRPRALADDVTQSEVIAYSPTSGRDAAANGAGVGQKPPGELRQWLRLMVGVAILVAAGTVGFWVARPATTDSMSAGATDNNRRSEVKPHDDVATPPMRDTSNRAGTIGPESSGEKTKLPEKKPMPQITIRLGSQPSKATLTVDGRPRGKTPLSIRLPKSKSLHVVVFSKTGYRRRTIRIPALKNQQLKVTLKRKRRVDNVFKPY